MIVFVLTSGNINAVVETAIGIKNEDEDVCEESPKIALVLCVIRVN